MLVIAMSSEHGPGPHPFAKTLTQHHAGITDAKTIRRALLFGHD